MAISVEVPIRKRGFVAVAIALEYEQADLLTFPE